MQDNMLCRGALANCASDTAGIAFKVAPPNEGANDSTGEGLERMLTNTGTEGTISTLSLLLVCLSFTVLLHPLKVFRGLDLLQLYRLTIHRLVIIRRVSEHDYISSTLPEHYCHYHLQANFFESVCVGNCEKTDGREEEHKEGLT